MLTRHVLHESCRDKVAGHRTPSQLGCEPYKLAYKERPPGSAGEAVKV